jgi:hypothetical protein
MAPCSMPLLSMLYTLSWRKWGLAGLVKIFLKVLLSDLSLRDSAGFGGLREADGLFSETWSLTRGPVIFPAFSASAGEVYDTRRRRSGQTRIFLQHLSICAP